MTDSDEVKLLPDDDEETYQIGLRDGYDRAVQDIDLLTGGDGEYRYCTNHDPERHCPDAATMKARIAERFAARPPVVTDGVVERVKACAAREANRVIEMLSERELELLRKVENYGNLIAYLASDTHDVKPDAIRTLARNALAASADRSPEGGGPEEGRHAKHESATAESGDAQPTPVSDPISNKGR